MELGWTHCVKNRQQMDNKTNGVLTRNRDNGKRQTKKKMEGCHKMLRRNGMDKNSKE